MQTITLSSLPPSVNTMFSNVPGKGRVKTKEYAAWRESSAWEVAAQKPRRFDCEVSISIKLVAQSNRRQDADNRLKGLGDLLVLTKVIKDDSNSIVRKLTVEWVEDGPPVTIEISEYGN